MGEYMQFTSYAKYAWTVLGYNLLVILWGAYVRATGSGAGCGSHWPLCNGEVIPLQPAISTIIEFTHRLMSGLSLILVVVLFVWAFRSYEKGQSVRLGATLSLVFIIAEALVGAGLVLFEFVAEDASAGRAVSIVIHLLNTFMLLASLTLTGWWASGGRRLRLRGSEISLTLLGLGLAGTLLVGASGALAALGDTLFPAQSLAQGIQQELSPTSHFLLRLRILHPMLSIIVGTYLIISIGYISVNTMDITVRRFARLVTVLVAIQLGAGFINVLLLAPVWMQIVHLILADSVWIGLVLLSAAVFAWKGDPLTLDASRGSAEYFAGKEPA
jgi:heme A synthase